jgi:hypothetical protein
LLISANPQLEQKKENYIGKTALLRTVNHGKVYINKVEWNWNGKILSTASNTPIGFPSLYLTCDVNKNLACDNFKIEYTPTQDATIEITDVNQINDNTIFV